jgi:hypothetical protein
MLSARPDFPPVTSAEKLFCSLAMFAAASGLAIVISHVSKRMDVLDSRELKYEQKVEAMKSYLVHKNVPKAMVQKIHDHFHFKYVRLSTDLFGEHQNLQTNLSPSLRLEVLEHMHRYPISRVTFFEGRRHCISSHTTSRARRKETLSASTHAQILRGYTLTTRTAIKERLEICGFCEINMLVEEDNSPRRCDSSSLHLRAIHRNIRFAFRRQMRTTGRDIPVPRVSLSLRRWLTTAVFAYLHSIVSGRA